MRYRVALAFAFIIAGFACAPYAYADNATTTDVDVLPLEAEATTTTATTSDPEPSVAAVEPETPLADNEEYITQPIEYDPTTNSYYFLNTQQYCDDSVDPATNRLGVTIYRAYIGAYTDPDKYNVEGHATADCTQFYDKIRLYDAFQFPLGSHVGDESITITTWKKTYILRFHDENGIITAPGAATFDYHSVFVPVRDTVNEHRVLSASTTGATLNLEQSACDLFLSSVGGLGPGWIAMGQYDWLGDHAIWIGTYRPQDIGLYTPDNWPIFQSAHGGIGMLKTQDFSTTGNPACDNAGAFRHTDLDTLLPDSSDGTTYLFFWYSTQTEPWHFYDVNHMNGHPLGYIKLNRTNGVWSVVDEPVVPNVSSVLFLPGIESSRLYMRGSDGSDYQLWEPSSRLQIPQLAMNSDGTSVNQIYTKDIIDTLYPSWSGSSGLGRQVYSGLESYMDGLVSDGTIHAWQSFPYDWRYDVRDIVTDGTLTEQNDKTIARVYPEDVLTALASSSPSGKVTIIAHSNGALLAKALMLKLRADGKEQLVDKVIMIGTPQWGTPTSVGSMLHGDGGTQMLGLVMYGGDVRGVAQGMPGTYGLLPSPEYFSHVTDPVTTFTSDELPSLFAPHFPHGITSFDDLVSFVTDAFGINNALGDHNDLRTPLALNATLVEKAASTHAALDAWTPATTTSVTSIVGWGQPTPYQYVYRDSFGYKLCRLIFSKNICESDKAIEHAPLLTEDGDNTVVAPSAAGTVGTTWYFNTVRYKDDRNPIYIHQYLTSAPPIQNTLTDLLEGKTVSSVYVSDTEPVGSLHPLTIVGIHSPVNPFITDSEGNQTGIVPVPGQEGIYIKKQEISGSSVQVSGEEKFVYLPAGGEYTLSFAGYALGEVTVTIADANANGVASTTTTFAHIPVTTHTTGTLTFSSATDVSSLIADIDGDGATDTTLVPTPGTAVSYTPPVHAPIAHPSSGTLPVSVVATTTGTIVAPHAFLYIPPVVPRVFQNTLPQPLADTFSVEKVNTQLAGVDSAIPTAWWNWVSRLYDWVMGFFHWF